MSLTKKQLEIVDVLQNGGHIWKAGDSFYLAEQIGTWDSGAPRYQSVRMPKKTFDSLLAQGVLKKTITKDNQWRLR
jgi:hypothetical protein